MCYFLPGVSSINIGFLCLFQHSEEVLQQIALLLKGPLHQDNTNM